jgi:hypothetical protein
VQLPVAALVYTATIWLLWRCSGRPSGAEARLMDLIRARLKR